MCACGQDRSRGSSRVALLLQPIGDRLVDYIPEADDDSFDLLCAAIAEHVDEATYRAIMATLEELYEKRSRVIAAASLK
jgi:glutathionyl-hydroquinone reductase